MSTVLIVVDYPAVRKILRRLLERLCSVVCIEASNGFDAIAKAEKFSPGPNHSGFGHAGNERI